MKALVTGATGFVGAAVARKLLSAQCQVRVLARRGSDRRNLQGLDVEVCEGDLTDSSSLQRAAQGCEGMFHVAADYRLGARDPAELYRTNVEGTRNVLDAAQRSGVRRIVYTSSVATIGIPADGTPGDELSANSLENMIGHYKRSKYLAEEVVREAAQGGISVVIVSPSTPVGPGDVKPTPTGQLVLDAAAGRMPAYVDTGLNIVHVDDVAAGHLLAYERGNSGERYILGGEDMSLREILALIAGLRAPPSARTAAVRRGSAHRLPGRRRLADLGPQRTHHLGRRAHVAQEDVLLERQGAARTGVFDRARRCRRSRTRFAGFVTTDCCASRYVNLT